MAKAAEETVQMIDGRHRIAVAGSAEGVEWVAPMQSAANKPDVIRQIQKLDLGGAGIFAHMSIVEGKKVLEAEHSPIRHLILMCDGDDTKAQEDCEQLIVEMRQEKITTSTVAIGTGKDLQFLQHIAALGGGRYYLADHANKLPAIMTQDSSIVARSAIEEGAFLPKLIEGDEVLRGITSTPPLLAYDLTDFRPLARTGMKTGKDDPFVGHVAVRIGNESCVYVRCPATLGQELGRLGRVFNFLGASGTGHNPSPRAKQLPDSGDREPGKGAGSGQGSGSDRQSALVANAGRPGRRARR